MHAVLGRVREERGGRRDESRAEKSRAAAGEDSNGMFLCAREEKRGAERGARGVCQTRAVEEVGAEGVEEVEGQGWRFRGRNGTGEDRARSEVKRMEGKVEEARNYTEGRSREKPQEEEGANGRESALKPERVGRGGGGGRGGGSCVEIHAEGDYLCQERKVESRVRATEAQRRARGREEEG